MSRIINVLLALDNLLFAVCTLGGSYPYESFSSAAYRGEMMGKAYGRARKWIDAALGEGHCMRAYYAAKFNLPEDMR